MRWKGAALDAAVLALGLFACRVDPSRQDSPVPDARTYATLSASIAAGEGPWMRIGEARFPPFNPPALAYLLAPLYALLPGDGLGRGLWGILLLAAGTLVLARRVGDRLAGPPAGIVAVLLLLLAPAFTSASQWILAEIPATFVALLAFALLLPCPGRGTFRAAAAGLAVGIAGLLRPTGFLLAPAFLPLVLAGRGRPERLGAFAAGGLLGLATLLASNAAFYGSALRSGYHTYGSFLYDYPGTGFSVAHAVATEARFDGKPGPGNLYLYLGDLLGSARTLLPLPAAALAVFGLARLRRRQGGAVAAVAMAAALSLGFHSLYYWQEPRYLLPLAPLLAAAAGAGYATLRRCPPLGLPAALALATSCLVLQGPKALAYIRGAPPPPREAQVLRAAASVMEPDAALVTPIHPVLVRHYVLRGTARAHIPLTDFVLHVHREPVPGPLPPFPPRAAFAEAFALYLAWAEERGHRPFLIPGAVRWLDDLESRLLAERPVYIEDLSRATAPEAFRAVEERFRLERVARSEAGAIHRVSRLDAK